MIPYYSPNFSASDLCKTLFKRTKESALTEYFKQLTGKKYVLFTSSCRSALYLAYKSVERTGLVHTSPLTCKEALFPIIAAGNRISFSDVKNDDWTIDPELTLNAIGKDSFAIQAIHFGGFLCNMKRLREIADKNRLLLIEDCAQGYNTAEKQIPLGGLSDIACFTLTKNMFGLGGGVLVTDNENFYLKAKAMQDNFPCMSNTRLIGRALLSTVSTYRTNKFVEMMYQFLMETKEQCLKKKKIHKDYSFVKELKKPSKLYEKSVLTRLVKIKDLIEMRKKKAAIIINTLTELGYNFQSSTVSSSSYTKLYCLCNHSDAKVLIKQLNDAGIEAKHLEHKHKTFYQNRFDADPDFMLGFHDSILENYNAIHDRIISLPLYEHISNKAVKIIANTLKNG